GCRRIGDGTLHDAYNTGHARVDRAGVFIPTWFGERERIRKRLVSLRRSGISKTGAPVRIAAGGKEHFRVGVHLIATLNGKLRRGRAAQECDVMKSLKLPSDGIA